MLFVLVAMFLCYLLILSLKIISNFISEKCGLMREELTPYECGFEHLGSARVPFSLRYFFLTLIFLLFDLEIVLMLFIPQVLLSSQIHFSVFFLLIFLVFLLLSLVYEWVDGSLEWLS